MKTDFDPSTVPQSVKQSKLSQAFLGVNPKRLPAYNDAAMQERVTGIGEKLVPAYQRDLSDSDPAKIQFRFQVVESKIWWDALALPSGVILISHDVVERLENDSQLAAVLADNIAAVLERQQYRVQPAGRALAAGQLAMLAGGIFVPGLGLAGDLGAGAATVGILVKAEEQSSRVALGLLQDAGYDIDQAPLAWWHLGSKKAKPIAEITLPRRAKYAYKMLGENWHNPALVLSAP